MLVTYKKSAMHVMYFNIFTRILNLNHCTWFAHCTHKSQLIQLTPFGVHSRFTYVKSPIQKMKEEWRGKKRRGEKDIISFVSATQAAQQEVSRVSKWECGLKRINWRVWSNGSFEINQYMDRMLNFLSSFL